MAGSARYHGILIVKYSFVTGTRKSLFSSRNIFICSILGITDYAKVVLLCTEKTKHFTSIYDCMAKIIIDHTVLLEKMSFIQQFNLRM